MEVDQEIAIAAAPGPDYSVWGLVMQADPVVKGVMLLLVLASIACWAIVFEKMIRIWRANRAVNRLATARDSQSQSGLTRAVLLAGEREAETSPEDSATERRARVESAMRGELKAPFEEAHGLETGGPKGPHYHSADLKVRTTVQRT